MRATYVRLVPIGLLPGLAGAVETNRQQALDAASPLAGGAIIETAVVLIAIVALIFLLSWLFRRFGRQAWNGKGMVSVVGGVSLGPRERAVLLQVDGTRLLVGVAPGQVRMLHVLGREIGEAADAAQFSGQLRREMGAES